MKQDAMPLSLVTHVDFDHIKKCNETKLQRRWLKLPLKTYRESTKISTLRDCVFRKLKRKISMHAISLTTQSTTDRNR